MDKKTPLYETHVAAKGKMVPFGGYILPVNYEESGVIAEHMAVRTAAGMFDVSHMGEVTYKGKDALKNIQHILTNDISGMYDGQVRYSPMCYDNGGVVDDLLVYKVADDDYLLVVNAGNKDKDVAWMKQHVFGDVEFKDVSESYGQIALQGPKSPEIIAKLLPDESIPKKYYSFKKDVVINGMKCLVSRTGYTGELGYEIYCNASDAVRMWNTVLEAGRPEGLIPCGLGARDTLRMEAAMPLYGHEMDETVTPIEAGLDFFVKFDKPDFIGKAAMQAAGAPKRIRVGLAVDGRGIVREHCALTTPDGKDAGHTTSGTFCPFMKAPIAMALVSTEYSKVGTKLMADVRGRKIAVEVIPLPFYTRPKKK